MVAQPPLREAEAANWDFFLKIPETDRKPLSPEPGEGRPAAPAALRVLRRLLRLRRNPVHQADDAALRRPHADRQRHRLLLDLRRQPAHHALLHQRRRPRTRLVQLAVRRQRRVRPRACAWPSTSRTNTPANWSGGSASQIGEELAQAILERRPEDRSRASSPQRERVEAAQGETRRRRYSPKRATCSAWPMPWSRRASGSSAATAGPTTSATAASITCSPPAATSTSWCSIPRSTRTPAARRPSPRRAARSPSSPPAASRSARRTSP